MPIFDYLCKDSGKQGEIFLSISEYKPECFECGSLNLKKMISKLLSFSDISTSGLPGHGDISCCGKTF
jgi:putative FmdB family regulatory protein